MRPECTATKQRIHLSNYDINARENNMHNYLAHKPEVLVCRLLKSHSFVNLALLFKICVGFFSSFEVLLCT